MVPARARSPFGVVGRAAECRRIDEFAGRLESDPRSLVLVGEAGIGKTTLWNHGLARCRATRAQVLVARPAEEDRHSPAQGLLDLFDPRLLPAGTSVPAGDLPVLERCRLVLDLLRALAARAPVVLAVDDLPWLDDLSARVLRFALRRLVDEPVALFATARTWSPEALGTPVRDLDRTVDLLQLQGMTAAELRRIVIDAVPASTVPVAIQAGDLAHGNPFFAIELARGSSPTAPERSPLAALSRRVAGLSPSTLRLARLLAVAGPSPLPVLTAAAGVAGLDDALRAGAEADILTLDQDFVLRFTHPLIATAVLGGLDPLDRQALHAALARVVADPDARAVHRAHALVEPDPAAAAEIETAALRVARRGAPGLAADLLGHSARLTPAADLAGYARRTLARMMQCAAAGDLPTASRLAGTLLDRLGPGPLRAEVVTGRVVLDFTDAEPFLRSALRDVPADGQAGHEILRGRLLGLLGWLLAVYFGRLEEGLGYARSALELGRAHGDPVLTAQAAATVSTTSLLLGRRADTLMAEAEELGPQVVRSELALWPRVLQSRQQLWDGHLGRARVGLDAMYRSAVANGAEFQRPYRLCDLAQASLAAGDLELAGQQARDGIEAARDCGDERAVSWLAYPAGLVSALRGETAAARWSADRLEEWAGRVGERPRQAMASHVRGVLAAAGQDWGAGLEHLLAALALLDELGYVHPGPVPVLPQAIELAGLAGTSDRVELLVTTMASRCAGLASPWANAQLVSATGQLMLLRDQPEALGTLLGAHAELLALGYRLDAARVGCLAVAAGLRARQRRLVRPVAEGSLELLLANRVQGWQQLTGELLDRVRGGTGDELTPTEAEIARLVTAGLRNRQIAGRLFVSESTVEAHLTRIYRKLGVRNRVELSHRTAEDR